MRRSKKHHLFGAGERGRCPGAANAADAADSAVEATKPQADTK